MSTAQFTWPLLLVHLFLLRASIQFHVWHSAYIHWNGNICNYMAFNENKLRNERKNIKSFSPRWVRIWNVNFHFHFRSVNFHLNLESRDHGLFRSGWVNWISMGQKMFYLMPRTHACGGNGDKSGKWKQ